MRWGIAELAEHITPAPRSQEMEAGEPEFRSFLAT